MKKIVISIVLLFTSLFLIGKTLATTPYDLYIPYCTSQGGKVVDDKCEFSTQKCDLEDFFYGKTCQEYDYCSTHGFKIIYMENLDMGGWTARMPVCEDANRKQCTREDVIKGVCQSTDKSISVSELVGLDHLGFGAVFFAQNNTDSSVVTTTSPSDIPITETPTSTFKAIDEQKTSVDSQTSPTTNQATNPTTPENKSINKDLGAVLVNILDSTNDKTKSPTTAKTELWYLFILLPLIIIALAITVFIYIKKRKNNR